MNAVLYDIEITTDMTHGWKEWIQEIYVPELHLYVNYKSCFFEDDSRMVNSENKRTIKINDDLVKDLKKHVESFIVAKKNLEKSKAEFVGGYLRRSK